MSSREDFQNSVEKEAGSQAVEIEINGERVVLDPSGALWWECRRTLVVADLHFEKGSFYAYSGQLLPPYDTRSTLKRIKRLIDHFAPDRMIALGDSFHDREAANRLDEFERGMLSDFASRCEWIWISGNHDPLPLCPHQVGLSDRQRQHPRHLGLQADQRDGRE